MSELETRKKKGIEDFQKAAKEYFSLYNDVIRLIDEDGEKISKELEKEFQNIFCSAPMGLLNKLKTGDKK